MDGAFGDLPLQVGVGQAEQAASVTGGKFAVGDRLLDVLRQLEQTHQVDHRGAVFAGAQSDGFGVQVEFGRHAGESAGRFHGVEVFPLDVLDEGDFQQAVVGDFADHHRNHGDFGKFGRAQPSFAGHQLVVAVDVADHQGLDNPVGPDGLSQFLQPNVLEDAPGLKGIGPDLVNRDGEGRLTRLRRRGGYGRGRRGVGTGGQERPHSLTEGSARLFGFVHGRGSLWRA